MIRRCSVIGLMAAMICAAIMAQTAPSSQGSSTLYQLYPTQTLDTGVKLQAGQQVTITVQPQLDPGDPASMQVLQVAGVTPATVTADNQPHTFTAGAAGELLITAPGGSVNINDQYSIIVAGITSQFGGSVSTPTTSPSGNSSPSPAPTVSLQLNFYTAGDGRGISGSRVFPFNRPLQVDACVTARNASGTEISLPQTGPAQIVVTWDGTPEASGLADSQGDFYFDVWFPGGTPPGFSSHTLQGTATLTGTTPSQATTTVNVANGSKAITVTARPSSITYTVDQPLTISGDVSGADFLTCGIPVESKIDLSIDDKPFASTTTVGGNFTLTISPPPSDLSGGLGVNVTATPLDTLRFNAGSTGFILFDRTKGGLQATISTDQQSYALDSQVNVSGMVQASGNPVAGANVTVQCDDGPARPVTTGSDGKFQFQTSIPALAGALQAKGMLLVPGTHHFTCQATATGYNASTCGTTYFNIALANPSLPAGTPGITAVTGSPTVVTYDAGGSSTSGTAAVGTTLPLKSIVQTGAGDSATLLIPVANGAALQMTVTPNTTVQMIANQNNGQTSLQVLVSNPGQVKVTVQNPTGAPLNYQIVTPAASISSLKTIYTITVDAEGNTTVQTDEGLVRVADLGGVTHSDVPAGQQVTVNVGQPVPPVDAAPQTTASSQPSGNPTNPASPAPEPGQTPHAFAFIPDPTEWSGPAPASAALPPGISTASDYLKIIRWATYRKITHFPRGTGSQVIDRVRISGDGSKIIFSTRTGIFSILPDGSGLTPIYSGLVQWMDFSRDGRRIAGYLPKKEGGIFVANADGSNLTMLAPGCQPIALRMTDDGSTIFAVCPGQDGLFRIPSDGSAPQKIISTESVCKLLHIVPNANHWRANFDISGDGSRIVFHLLFDAFAAHGDGSSIHVLTHYKGYAVANLCISDNGAQVAHFRDAQMQSAMVFNAFDSGPVGIFSRPGEAVSNILLSPDGKILARSWGTVFYSADGKSVYNPTATLGAIWANPSGLSMTSDFRRGVFIIDGPAAIDLARPSQIVVADFNPSSLQGAPRVDRITAWPNYVLSEGVSLVRASLRTDAVKPLGVNAIFIRNGEPIAGMHQQWSLHDDGRAGDAVANDGIFSHDGLYAAPGNPSVPVVPGPASLRYYVVDKDWNMTVVDAAGMEIRAAMKCRHTIATIAILAAVLSCRAFAQTDTTTKLSAVMIQVGLTVDTSGAPTAIKGTSGTGTYLNVGLFQVALVNVTPNPAGAAVMLQQLTAADTASAASGSPPGTITPTTVNGENGITYFQSSQTDALSTDLIDLEYTSGSYFIHLQYADTVKIPSASDPTQADARPVAIQTADNNAQAAAQAFFHKFQLAMADQSISPPLKISIALDRTSAPRFSAIKLSGSGFRSGVPIDILIGGVEEYEIRTSNADGTLPDQTWIWVPDDAPLDQPLGVQAVEIDGDNRPQSNTVSLTVTSMTMPQIVENLDTVCQKYFATIPSNPYGFTNGPYYNIQVTIGRQTDDRWCCGGYQAQVLSFFDSLRFNPDITQRALLDGLDYGPYFSGPTDTPWHCFVIVWPHGLVMTGPPSAPGGFDHIPTATQDGIVFDPWRTQKPELYEITPGSAGWAKDCQFSSHWQFAGHPSFINLTPTPLIPHPPYQGDYPCDGGTYYKPMHPLNNNAAIITALDDSNHAPISVDAQCPIVMQATDSQGRLEGTNDAGQPIDQIPDAALFSAPGPGGDTDWGGNLPAGKYTLKITGTDTGNFQLTIGTTVQTRGYPSLPITKGQTYTMTIDSAAAPPDITDAQGHTYPPTAAVTNSPSTSTAAAHTAGLPPGISVASPNLNVTRWATYRPITHFPRGPDSQSISLAKISGDGSTILFASHSGLFTIHPDGTSLRRMYDKQPTLIDISRDGRKIAWFDPSVDPSGQLFVANSDGSALQPIPGGFRLIAMRMTDDGSKLFGLCPEKNGIFVFQSDASAIHRILTTAQACKTAAIGENGNFWNSNFDISGDGSHLVAQLLNIVIAARGDGSDLHVLWRYKDYAVEKLAISDDGQTAAHFRKIWPRTAAVFCNFDGGTQTPVACPRDDAGDIVLSPDGATMVRTPGTCFYDRDGTIYNPTDIPAPLWVNPLRLSMTRDFRRGVLVIQGSDSSQLLVADFNPAALQGAPQVRQISATPATVTSNGSSAVTASLATDAVQPRAVNAVWIRGGQSIPGIVQMWSLHDDGRSGDAVAGDGIFSHNGLSIQLSNPKFPVSPGPAGLRFFVQDKDNNLTIVDVEGMEIRQP